jgi:hypothetical protein
LILAIKPKSDSIICPSFFLYNKNFTPLLLHPLLPLSSAYPTEDDGVVRELRKLGRGKQLQWL